jgi:ATP synthase F1 delta subunit
MSSRIIAKRYTKALIIEALIQNKLARINEELKAFVFLYNNYRSDFYKLMSNPVFIYIEKKRFILSVVKRYSMSDLLKNFLLVLIKRNRIYLLPLIKNEYIKDMDNINGKIRVKIIISKVLTKAIFTKLILKLKILLGKQIIPEVSYNENILAGIKINIYGLVFDCTVKNQLNNFIKKLTR